jgi:hypothetical protein
MILIQQSKVPDRHSPRKSKSHLPSRKGCARCAGVDRGVHICMHDARLEKPCVYECCMYPVRVTCSLPLPVRSCRFLNSWMRAYALPPGIEDACMYVCIYSYIRDMQVLNAVEFRMPGLVGRYGGTFCPSGLRRADIHRRPYRPVCVYTVHTVLTVCAGVSCVRLLFTRLRRWLLPAPHHGMYVYSTYY